MATDEQEKYLAKKVASIRYLRDNQVPQCFQKLLNDIVLEPPDDIFGHMADYFADHARPPTIANVTGSEILSCRGYPSFQVEIEALIHGNIMTLSTFTAPHDSKPLPESKPILKGKNPAPDSKISIEDGQLSPDQENEEDKIQSTINNINNCIKSSLKGCKLYNHQEIDKILGTIISKRSTNSTLSSTTSIEQEIENEKSGKTDEALPNDEMDLVEEESAESAVHLDILTVSMALTQSASYLKKCQLYHYLYKTANNEEPNSLCLPTPMMRILSSGKKTAGKLYLIKDVVIFMKKNLPPMQALKQLTDIYKQLELIVQQKPTSNMTADSGAFTPVLDKPEQALDLVRDVISGAGYSFEDDVIVAINFASNDLYDKDKQKYEICMNTLKTCDELVNVYVDLSERYPEIKVMIDPFLSREREGYSKLNEKMKGNCFIINQECFSNNPKVLRNILNEGFVSGNILKMENASTVTRFLEQARYIEDCPRILLISPNEVGTHETIMVDMAVAVQADFIIFDGPGRSENIRKYNRLVAIEHDLNILNLLIQKEPLLPQCIVHSPTEEPIDGGENATTE